MNITKAKYINKENDGVLITFDDGSIFTIPTFQNRYMHTDLFNEWISIEGNSIEVYQTASELEASNIAESKATALKYLRDTDFYMTIDKYETLVIDRQNELKMLRAEARVVVNAQ